jgi:prevent-host-death family protein
MSKEVPQMSAMPNIVPISELRQDASSIVREASVTGDPVFITQHGRASAVLMSAGTYVSMTVEN